MKKLIVAISTVLLAGCATVSPMGFVTDVAANVTSTTIYKKIFAEEAKVEKVTPPAKPKEASVPAIQQPKKAPEPKKDVVEETIDNAVAKVEDTVKDVKEAILPTVEVIATREATIPLWWFYAAGLLVLLFIVFKFKKKVK